MKNKVKTKGKSIKKSWNNFGRNLTTKSMVDNYYSRIFLTAKPEEKEKLHKFWINTTRRLGNNTKSLGHYYLNKKAGNESLTIKNFMDNIKNKRIENEANYRNIKNLKKQIEEAKLTNLEIADLFLRTDKIPAANQEKFAKQMKFVTYLKNKKTKQNNRRHGSSNTRNKAQVGMEIGKILF